MDAASYRSAGTEGTDGALQGARAVGGEAAGAAQQVPARRVCRGAEVRRRDAEVAPERLGELGGLAVPDPVGDLAHGDAAAGEQLGGAVHADAA